MGGERSDARIACKHLHLTITRRIRTVTPRILSGFAYFYDEDAKQHDCVFTLKKIDFVYHAPPVDVAAITVSRQRALSEGVMLAPFRRHSSISSVASSSSAGGSSGVSGSGAHLAHGE